ncbi:MAG TPA: hypothetical protein VJ944_00160 [Thermoplasmataceae archaeon]|nr:hypothetical protein [Thermoplasmataceae archaeon]
MTVTGGFGLVTSEHPSSLAAIESFVKVRINGTFHLTYAPLSDKLYGPWEVIGNFTLEQNDVGNLRNVSSITHGQMHATML